MPDTKAIITDLQIRRMRTIDPCAGADNRRGGAGPTDHKAVTTDGMKITIPDPVDTPGVARGWQKWRVHRRAELSEARQLP